jgi:hypothetical protein
MVEQASYLSTLLDGALCGRFVAAVGGGEYDEATYQRGGTDDARQRSEATGLGLLYLCGRRCGLRWRVDFTSAGEGEIDLQNDQEESKNDQGNSVNSTKLHEPSVCSPLSDESMSAGDGPSGDYCIPHTGFQEHQHGAGGGGR